MSQVTDKDTAHVADLIKIAIPENEIHKFTEQLNTVLPAAAVVQEADTAGVAPTAQTHGLNTVLRPDEPQPGLDMNTYPNRRNLKNGYFVVKGVFAEE